MIDYTHIPMHVRISERWKINPDYDAARYYGSLDRRRGDGVMGPFREWSRVPEIVLDYALSVSHTGTRNLFPIAGAVGMLTDDFCVMVKSHRDKRNGRGRKQACPASGKRV